MLQILKNIFKHLIKNNVLVFGNISNIRSQIPCDLKPPLSQKPSGVERLVLADKGTKCSGPAKSAWKMVQVTQRTRATSQSLRQPYSLGLLFQS